jgi:hypothetical protein
MPKQIDDDMPTSVKVGWRDYKIETMSRGESVCRNRTGEILQVDERIRISDGVSRRHQSETLLHEIMHAVYWLWNVSEKMDEEPIVLSLAGGLATVWRDNPAVMEWIARGLE